MLICINCLKRYSVQMDRDEESYPRLLEGYIRDTDYEDVYDSLLDRVEEGELQYARRALVVGPGPGIREIKFLNRLTPRLERAAFLEPNPAYFEELDRNVASLFENEVVTDTCHSTVEEWENEGGSYDVILMFHCLYGLGEGVRRAVLRRCVEQWLSPSGLVFITMVDDKNHDYTHGSVVNLLMRELHVTTIIDINDVTRDFISIGRSVHREYPYNLKLNIGCVSQETVRFIRHYCSQDRTEEAVRAAFEALLQRGCDGVTPECMCVVRGNCGEGFGDSMELK